ncbi:MAG: ATP-dependent DNA ligase [Candidatus Pacearchaeota archaeon]
MREENIKEKMSEMLYSEFVEVYEALAGTTKRLEKISIIAEFLKKLKKKGKSEWSYLLLGRVVPDYDSREIGISRQLAIKAISHSFGVKEDEIEKRLRKIGDLGEVAEEFSSKRKQKALFAKKLSVEKVFDSLRKIMVVEGKGAIEKKMNLISELLGNASSVEAKYIIRTLISDLRIGVSAPTIVDALALAFLSGVENASEKIQAAYDLANDFAIVLDAAASGVKEIEKINVIPGKPLNVMLAVKVSDIKEAFEVCGRPAALEQKYDGFRMVISKKGKEILLFTRRLENVTNQFPDVVSAVRENVKGESFILDSEVVGYDSKTKKYKPFEAISQRIKRKYDIEKLVKALPVEVNVFDAIYYNGESLIDKPFFERRKVVEKIVNEKKWVIRPAVQIITDNEEEAMKFYEEALEVGEEGIMIKNLNAPYKQGRRVGYMVKLKPVLNDFDLAIVGAEYGTGKRGGWLTSYILACRDEKTGKLLEVGKVSSGLKELRSSEEISGRTKVPKGEKYYEGTTYEEMTKILKPLIIGEKGKVVKVKPKIVVSVNYQNIQESPSYDSGYALRFPRITAYRPDRKVDDINTLAEIKAAAKKQR